MVRSEIVTSACTPNLRLRLKSFLHVRSFFTNFSPSHALSKAAPNIGPYRRALLSEILSHDIGVSSRSLSGWSQLKLDLEMHLLPHLGNLIDNHKKFSYRDCLQSCIAKYSSMSSTEEALPDKVVTSFVKLVVWKVIPYSFIGNNERGLQKLALAIVRGRTPVTIKQLLYYIPGRLSKGWLGSLNDPIAQLHIAIKLLLWITVDFIPEVIKTVLYGTKPVSRLNPIYYTKKTWQSKTAVALNDLLQCGYLKKLPKEEFLVHPDNRGQLRFQPKINGLRPIVVRRMKDAETVNRMTKAKLLMRFITPKSLKIDEEWTKFKHHVLEARSAGEKGEVIFVRCDVRSAFVTVRQDKILEVLDKHFENLPSQIQIEQPIRRFWRGSVTQKMERKQHEISESTQATISQQSAPTMQTTKMTVPRDLVYRTIVREVKQQIVRYLKNDYLMCVGLAQGGPLSSHLCNMTLENMAQAHLSEFTSQDGTSVLWRVADDFLLLTLDEKIAKRFQEAIKKGFHSYGWHMNESKGDTNLLNREVTTVTFNGAIFNFESLEAKADMSIYTADNVVNFISCKRNFHSVNELYEKQLASLGSLKLVPLYLNMSCLSRARVLEHIASAAQLQALRFRGLTQYLMANEARDENSCHLILNVLHKTSNMISSCICKILKRTAPENTPNIPTSAEIRWLLNLALLRRTAGYTCPKLRNILKWETQKLEQQIDPSLMKQLYEAHASQQNEKGQQF